jgi:serine/threonine-protein kinase
MKDLAAGQALGRYELLLPVAKGGMAQVWAARLRGTRGFQKIVAIKTILAGDMDDERMERMFLEEATLASQIHHPNVVGTLDLGEHEGILYLVMEWVEGESLNFMMRRAADQKGIPLPIAVNLIGQACKGLHAAHDLRDESGALLGVVHRDISAQNVLVTYSGTAKLVDFGIAKATARSSELTEAGEIKGKFAYLAPEQAVGQAVDRRTDIFGMGILLYFLSTGRHPFRGTNAGETLRNICSLAPPRAPSSIVADYPVELERVVMKALHKAPDERWETAHDMLTALERAMPQCLDGSFEAQVAAFMSQLLGNRCRERRTELKLAQQMLNAARGEGLALDPLTGSSGSGSLRAISVGQSEGSLEASLSRRGVIPPVGTSDATIDIRGRRPFMTRSRMLAVGAAAFAAMAFALARQSTHPRTEPSLAASPTPAAPPAIEPRPDPAPKIAAPVPPPAPPPPPTLPEETQEPAKKTRKAAPVAPPRASAAPPAPATAPANPPSAAPPERPRNDARDGSSNAWDPGSFGGRR